MSKDTLIIKVDNDFIYINEFEKITYDNSNLPKQYFKFITERPVFLKLKQLTYDKDTGTLKVEVIDYNPSYNSIPTDQVFISQIRRIEFEKMDWIKFNPLIFSYTFNRIKGVFFNAHVAENQAIEYSRKKDSEYLRSKAPNLFSSEPKIPVVESIQVVIKVKFEETTFFDGGVKFTIRLKKNNLAIDLTIENPQIKKEFENIKPWFEKKIGKSFNVTIDLKFIDNQLQESIAMSDDILKINEELIESIKIYRVLNLVKASPKNDESKSVLTSADIFAILDDTSDNQNILNSSARDILEILIKNDQAKNVKQLRYLSGDKQSLDEKLRFTVKPNFGFLFIIDTPNNIFLIWELLNSHATYLWKLTSQHGGLDSFIEAEISYIRSNGREEYKRHYKGLTSKGYEFYILEHVSTELTEEERFQAWKAKIDSIIYG